MFLKVGIHNPQFLYSMNKILRNPIIKKALSLLIHPFTLSLIVTLIILAILPLNIPKYQLKIEESTRGSLKGIVVWKDLENDSVSDWVLISQDPIGYAVAAVYLYPTGRVKEWDIPGKLLLDYNNYFFIVDEAFPGKDKEIFVFTQSHDSIFLNRISDFSLQKPVFKQIFLTKFRLVNGSSDIRIVTPLMVDLDLDGAKELIFGISAGFSIYPRALFTYDLINDTICRSIETGNSLNGFLIADVTGDRKKEIITSGYAPANIVDTIVQYHDSSNWAMVFNNKLQLLLPPSEFEGRTGHIAPFSCPTKSSHQTLFVIWNTPSDSQHGLQLYRISSSGEKRFFKEFTEFEKQKYTHDQFYKKNSHGYKFVIPMKNGDLFLFDTTFRTVDLYELNQPITYLQQFDVDIDGQTEILNFDKVSKLLTIYREDFGHPASVNVECADPQHTTISLKEDKDKPTLISLCTGNLQYLLSYQKNPFWQTRWGVWAAIWLAVFLFTLLIRKTTRIQLEKRFATEKKITELQLKIVRNQMDPHFTMNAINAVVDAIRREETDQACDNLLHFSKMYRSLVLSADKIKRTLREEIDFTENYLALEKFRFGNRFIYTIRINPDVDMNWEVPKMVIQSPVENAVKHGLLKKEAGGEIVIFARHEDRKLILEITDNGVGRAASAVEGKTSTGKGMEIMEQFFDLYHKITGIRVYSEIIDLNNPENEQNGTKVITIIPLKSSPGKQP